MSNLLVKQKTMVGARKNTQFQKALRLMKNDIWNGMLYGRNKVISLDCSIKQFFWCHIMQEQRSWYLPFNRVLKASLSVYLIKACVCCFCQIYFFTKWLPFKNWKIFFISSKKLFPFSRHSNICNFPPSFPHFPDSKEQMEVE